MPKVLNAGEINPARLDAFLSRMYTPAKSAFLRENGDWWHRSNTNRLVIQVEKRVVGYCAVIPTKVLVASEIHNALWWVDLVIDPEFRGRGLQTLFDRRVREMADLLLGFPNELAARIHRKHGWGVRDDLRVLMLPLQPPQTRPVRRAAGSRGNILRAGSIGLQPLAWGWRSWISTRRTPRSWQMDTLDSNALFDIFERTCPNGLQTTWRDPASFEWRYGAVPYPNEYRYYLAGDAGDFGTPTQYLVARHFEQPDGIRQTRILDLFGDFQDSASLKDLLTLVVQDAISYGSSQVTVLAANPNLKRISRQLGFLFSAPVGFCWWSPSSTLMSVFVGDCYWTLGDSDNDASD